MTRVIGGPAAPVRVSTEKHTGGTAIPVWLCDDGDPTQPVEAGPALPVRPVTDAELASGAFKLQAGPARRVSVLRNAPRTQVAGPAVPMWRAGGGDTTTARMWGGFDLLEYALATWGSDVVAVFTGGEQTGTAMIDSANGHEGVYSGTTPLTGSPFGFYRRCDALNDGARYHSASFEADWNWSEYSFIAPARINSAGVWSDGTQRHLWRLVNSGLGIISQVTKHTTANQIQFECHVNGVNTQATRSLGGTLDWFLTMLTFNDAADRSRFYVASNDIPAEMVAERSQTNSPSGTLNADRCSIGCSNYSTLANLFDGDLWPLIILRREATLAEFTPLAALVV